MTKKKISIEDVLKKKQLIEQNEIKPFYSKVFDAEIDIEDVSVEQIMSIIESADESEPLRADDELIYACCPFFRDKELQEQLGVKDPIETVRAVYGKNISEPTQLVKHILSFYGVDFSQMVQKIKK